MTSANPNYTTDLAGQLDAALRNALAVFVEPCLDALVALGFVSPVEATEFRGYLGIAPAEVEARCLLCDAGPVRVDHLGNFLCPQCAALFGWDGAAGSVEIKVDVFGSLDDPINLQEYGTPGPEPAPVYRVEQLDDTCRGWVWTDNDGESYRWHEDRWQYRLGGWRTWYDMTPEMIAAGWLSAYGPYTRGEAS